MHFFPKWEIIYFNKIGDICELNLQWVERTEMMYILSSIMIINDDRIRTGM